MHKRNILGIIAAAVLLSSLLVNAAPLSVANPTGTELGVSARADSLMRLIPTLKGKAEVEAWRTLLDYDEVYFDSLLGPQIAEQLIEACQRNNDVQAEAQARISRCYVYFNYDRVDDLHRLFSDDSLFYMEHGQTDKMFIEWAQIPEAYINQHEIGKAMAATRAMYNCAQKMHSDVGIGMAAHNFGFLYNSLGNDSVASEWYHTAVSRLEKCGDLSAYHFSASRLCEMLSSLGRYDELADFVGQWHRHVENSYRSGEAKITEETFKFYLFSIILEEANVLCYQGQLDRAEALLREAGAMENSMTDGHAVSLNFAWADLYRKRGDWQKAYEYITRCVDSEWTHNATFTQLAQIKMQAECLLRLGRWEEAARAYADYSNISDSLRSERVARQLSEMHTVYEVDEMRTQHEMQKQRQRFTTGGIALLIGLVAMLLLISINGRWRKRLQTKNRQLEREHNLVMRQNKQLAVERDRAETASRAKTAFMQSMTHEIRTPLNAISGFTQVMAMPGVELPAEERQQMTRGIVENTHLLANILDDMIEISDLESSSEAVAKEECVAAIILAQAADMVRPRLAKNDDGTPAVQFVTRCEVAEDFVFSSNSGLLLMALSKLLDNAAKFTKQGSITLTLQTQGGSLCFSIADTGPGIPEDKREYIFERFTKLNTFTQGTGLGLAVARMIAERLGGTLTLDDTYKGGAKFDIILPI